MDVLQRLYKCGKERSSLAIVITASFYYAEMKGSEM